LQIVTDLDSLTRDKKGKMPALSHLLSVGNGRVLSLAADDKYVYAGCHSGDNEIVVFSRTSLQPMYRLLGHQGSILALMVVPEKNWLVSSSSAGDIRVWSTNTLQPIYIIHPCDDTSGDIYCLAWDEREGGTLYFGDASITVALANLTLPNGTLSPPVNGHTNHTSHTNGPSSTASASPTLSQRTGRYKPHKFFDNPPSGYTSGITTPICSAPTSADKRQLQNQLEQLDLSHLPHSSHSRDLGIHRGCSHVTELEVDVSQRVAFAHYGYVYAMYMIERPNNTRWLVSGSGDTDVKIWECKPKGGLQLLKVFSGLEGAALSFSVRDSLLYAGLQDGQIVVWDLETSACVRTIEAHENDVLAMSVLGTDLYTSAADGKVIRVNEDFDCTAAFRGHSGIILSSTIVKDVGKDKWELITAGNDSYVKIWSIDVPSSRRDVNDFDVEGEGEGDVMLYALAKLIAVPTVSDEGHRESCRQGAHLLKKIFTQLGARSSVISGERGLNPLVLATFSGRETDKPRKRILFYGHYDVQPAAEGEWETNPWELSGRNGYLYGRGVSDNKGPVLAVACAAANLQQRRELDVDVVMLIEGEEEAGSKGFASVVQANKDKIGHIDAIMLSNSTWIGENDPCVVFGMRGVVYANLTISGEGDDAHSGVDGGIVAEPMFDMVRVLGAVAGPEGVNVPGFYDKIRAPSQDVTSCLADVARASGRSTEQLSKVWAQPSFSINSITSSGMGNKTVIPKRVSADISLRIVPDQSREEVVETLKEYCRKTFESLKSPNHFEITVTHSASWWLTQLDSPYFRALECAVKDIWDVEPLRIREGGTVPTIFWLEQEFGAPCVHLPLGQASDAGHLANERMRLLNLRNGKRVVESYFTRVAKI
ncbi:hypothetical protein TREMEDRAFT_33704, partial [Tremella mesenterica DSM 1558]|uniref:uncharacterized protein n=1 Tax=Tremella mesenterica (strain ATCC 24925 / CBS 8224 / DSM 1558 / NBRC 9311 / NRRL Y-6157 / RJB 2259-6 / UBC 559-6) TaxID=578456 RepID=UPI0003F49B2E